MKPKIKKQNKKRRHRRVRAKIFGSPERPRIAAFRSARHIVVQAIDDQNNKTIASANDLKEQKKLAAEKLEQPAPKGTKERIAYAVGLRMAELLKKKNIKEAVYDRGGFIYHGRVKAVADGLRKGGIIV